MPENLSIENQVIVGLRRISRAIDLHSRVLVQQHGLTAPQLAALQAVGKLQPVSVSVVARSIHLSMATVTGIFNRLEKRELVMRSRNGPDRRTVALELTDAGTRMLEAAPSLLQDRFRTKLAKLEEWEQTQLLASLQRIAAMMDAEGIEAAPVLGPGDVTALPEDFSRYLEKAVNPAEETVPADAQGLDGENKISSTSPLACALVGAKVGDKVVFHPPGGKVELTVLEIGRD